MTSETIDWLIFYSVIFGIPCGGVILILVGIFKIIRSYKEKRTLTVPITLTIVGIILAAGPFLLFF
jgi:hypothetical protein